MYKISFKKFDKIDVLFFDEFEINLKSKIKIIFFTKLKKIIFVRYLASAVLFFFKSLFFLKITNIKKKYFETIIKAINPNIAVGSDFGEKIFMFKSIFPDRSSITFQYSFVFENRKKDYIKMLKDKKTDYFFVFNKNMEKFVSQIFSKKKTKIFVAGSIRNNSQFLKKDYKNDIMYISEFRSENKKEIRRNTKILRNTKKNNLDNYRFLKIISNYYKKKNEKISLALASNRRDKMSQINFKKQEISYFSKINNNFIFSNKHAYDLAQKAKIIFSNLSNLGLELESMGKNVFFYQIGKKKINKQNFKTIISKFKKTNLKNKYKIVYDRNNSKLKKLIYKLLKQEQYD